MIRKLFYTISVSIGVFALVLPVSADPFVGSVSPSVKKIEFLQTGDSGEPEVVAQAYPDKNGVFVDVKGVFRKKIRNFEYWSL